jgi:protein SCO1/2
VIASPEGKVTRYLYGVKFTPQTVRLSLVEASDGKVGTTVDRWIMTCFQYDGKQGRYALAAIGAMRIGGVLTMLAVAVVLVRMIRRDNRLAAADAAAGPARSGQSTNQTNGPTGA